MCESLHAIQMVGSAPGLSTTVHGQNGIAHVDTLEWDGRSQDVAQCAASRNVAVVDKPLAGYTGFPAYFLKHSG